MEKIELAIIVISLVIVFLLILIVFELSGIMRINKITNLLGFYKMNKMLPGLTKIVNDATKQKYTARIPNNLIDDPIYEEIAKGGNSMNDISPAETYADLPWSNGMFTGYDTGSPYLQVMSYADQYVTWNGNNPNGSTLPQIVAPGKKCCPRWTKNKCRSSPYATCGCPQFVNKIDDPRSPLLQQSLSDIRNL